MKRKRSQLKKARNAVNKAAASFIKAGIMNPKSIVTRFGGEGERKWEPPKETKERKPKTRCR
jgi:hypothetical protein